MTQIQVSKIFPNPEQPRMDFDPIELETLAESIQQHGLLNAISVEGPHDEGIYILIDGERRWRAHQLAGMKTIEATVRPPMNGNGPRDRLVMAMVANLQRSEMNPIEVAQGYQNMRNLGYAVEDIARMVGISHSSIHMHMGLLKLEPEIRELFAQKRLPLGSQVTAALRKLPDDRRVGLARSFANKKASIQVIINICERMANATKGPDRPIAKGQNPMTTVAKKYNAIQAGHWNMISQAKTFMVDEKLRLAAEDTCRMCALFDDASEKTCRDCPAVTLLRKLTSVSTETVAK